MSGFRTGQDQFGGSISTDGGWGTAERFTWLPYYDEASEGASYLHLGLGHYFSNPPFDRAIFRTIPEFYVGENAPGLIGTAGVPQPGVFNGTPYFLSSGVMDVNAFNVFGKELLWVRGPFSLQSEAMGTTVDQTNGKVSNFWGYDAQVGWFPTGEHRPYDRVTGTIDRVKPMPDERDRGRSTTNIFGLRMPVDF